MLRGEMYHQTVFRIAQESRSGRHGLQNAGITFLSQFDRRGFEGGGEAHQSFRLMGVETVHHQMDFVSRWRLAQQVTQMGQDLRSWQQSNRGSGQIRAHSVANNPELSLIPTHSGREPVHL